MEHDHLLPPVLVFFGGPILKKWPKGIHNVSTDWAGTGVVQGLVKVQMVHGLEAGS